jgi:hypothetical protein
MTPAPRPQLTAAQRLHFDVYGYVLLEQALTPDEVEDLRRAVRRLAAEPEHALQAHRIYHFRRGDHYRHFGHLVEYDEALLRFATHPRLVPLVEEVVGGQVRVEETECIVNRRDPAADPEALRRRGCVPLGLHTGAEVGWGSFEERGRWHCLFVKTIAYLTDVGPEDGGTAVIPGSHRVGWGQEELIAAAMADPARLVRQVQARAGDVLLFAETLVHSTTEILSDRERMIVITGYTPTMLQVWPGNEVSEGFLQELPREQRELLVPERAWPWRRRRPPSPAG